jgi:hypothetical protein
MNYYYSQGNESTRNDISLKGYNWVNSDWLILVDNKIVIGGDYYDG